MLALDITELRPCYLIDPRCAIGDHLRELWEAKVRYRTDATRFVDSAPQRHLGNNRDVHRNSHLTVATERFTDDTLERDKFSILHIAAHRPILFVTVKSIEMNSVAFVGASRILPRTVLFSMSACVVVVESTMTR